MRATALDYIDASMFRVERDPPPSRFAALLQRAEQVSLAGLAVRRVGPDDTAPAAPGGQVIAGMAAVDSLYTGYGEGAPRGQGPTQERITREGEAYLAQEFPLLDRIVRTEVVRRNGGDGR